MNGQGNINSSTERFSVGQPIHPYKDLQAMLLSRDFCEYLVKKGRCKLGDDEDDNDR